MPAAAETDVLQLPPRPLRPDGRPRRVGVEIEFTGPDIARAAALVQGLFGGAVQVAGEHRRRVAGTALGDFTVELDMFAAHPARDGSPLEQKVRFAMGEVGRLILPFEIVSPPLPIERLGEMDRLVEALRLAGAQGTEGSLLYAFGLHLNPEIPDDRPATLLDHLKAYLLLSAWLRADIHVDLSRRMAPFIGRFDEDYVARVVDPAYRPGLEALARDYVAANPTRNRELDLLPLLAELAPGAVCDSVLGPLVKPRPTFHYRLPDSRVGVPGWSILPDWNRWVEVERLAADRTALDELGALWLDCFERGAIADWHRVIARRIGPGWTS